ncbi:MAG: hypothetical protein ACLSFT_08085 [Ruminococcus callidus]
MATETIGTLDYNEIVFPKLGIDLTSTAPPFRSAGWTFNGTAFSSRWDWCWQ